MCMTKTPLTVQSVSNRRENELRLQMSRSMGGRGLFERSVCLVGGRDHTVKSPDEKMLRLSRFLVAGDVAQFVPTPMTGMLPAGGAAAPVPHPCTFVRVRLSSTLHQPLSN